MINLLRWLSSITHYQGGLKFFSGLVDGRNNIQEGPIVHYYLKEQIIVLSETASALLIAGNVLVLVFALCGNSAAIIVCLRSKFNRSGTKFFLISLAVSDLLLAVSSSTISLSQLLTQYNAWSLGGFVCRVSDYTQTALIMVNGASLLAIAVDRCFAIVRGLQQPCMGPRLSSIVTYVVMALIWLIPLLIPIPMLFAYYVQPFLVWEKPIGGGNRVSDNITRYFCIKKGKFDERTFNLTYYIPLGVLYSVITIAFVLSYTSIMCFLRRNFRRPPRGSSAGSSICAGEKVGSVQPSAGLPRTSPTVPHHSRERRTARLLVALVSLFLLCRVPIWALLLYNNYNIIRTSTLYYLRFSLSLLAIVKSAVNPFIYTIWNSALKSQHPDSRNGSSATVCFCLGTSSGCCRRVLSQCWKSCKCCSPRVYDFTGQVRAHGSTEHTTSCFTVGNNKGDNKARLTSTQYSNCANTSTSKV